MLAPMLACLLLSIAHVYFGIHIVSRKVIFADLALAQIAALGATYATTLGYDPNLSQDELAIALFSLTFTFVGAGFFAIARMREEKVPQEGFIGIVYAAASAGAVLILSKSPSGGEELKHMLVGDILLVSMPTIITDFFIYGAIGVIHIIFRKKFLAISLDAEAAQNAGMNIRFWDLIFYMTFGTMVTRSVGIAGVLLVFSYLVIPAVIAQMWADTIRGRLILGWGLAILASLVGILWSFYADYPTGPAIVVTLAFFLIASGALYYVFYSVTRTRALAHVAAMALFTVGFAAGLAEFRKGSPPSATASLPAVDLLLRELQGDEIAGQLDAISHLGDLGDPRIVPALGDLLANTSNEQIVERIAEAMMKKKDTHAVPALLSAAGKDHDPFLKLTIAKALVELGERAGFGILTDIMKDDEAGFAQNQAIEIIREKAGQDFGYAPGASAAENKSAIAKIEQWWQRNGGSGR